METKLLNKFAIASTALLILLGNPAARAGTITVVGLPPTGTDAASGITTNKTYVSAFDFGSKDTVTYSVNGVPFAHVKTTANNTFLVTNWVDSNVLHGGQVIVSVAPTNHGINVTSSTPSGQADGNMNNLFFDQIFPGNGQPANGWMQEEYDNLTIGSQYSLRIYYRYQGGGTGQRLMNVYFNGEGNWQAYSGNPLQLDSGTNGVLPNGLICHGANYLKYDFIATATNVFCLITNINAGEGSTTFAATLENDSFPYAPFITYQPSVSGVGGGAFLFNVTAIGTPNLAYQWYHNTVSNYTGAVITTDGSGYSGSTTTNLLATTNLLDYYFAVVTNNYGSITSAITQVSPLPTIATQPSPAKVGNSIVFSMTAGGFLPLSYQWYHNAVSNYSGASMTIDGSGYSGSTTNSLTATTNFLDYYFIIVTNNYGSATSQIVRLAAPLTVLAAGEPIWNQTSQTNVVVNFSDVLDAATATTAGNYLLNNGASVSSATLVGSNEVVLVTSVLTPSTSYTLTVQNVKDFYGIPVSPSPTNIAVGLYPVNLALWVRADTGVTTDANGVTQWNDLSPNGNNLSQALGAPFEPQLATNAAGDPVIRFTATNETFMQAASTPSLAIVGDMSVIAVANFATLDGGTNGEIVSKTGAGAAANIPAPYDYYVISSSTGARFYRGNGSAFGQFTATQAPSVGMPHILVATESGNTVTHFLDGAVSGTGILNNNFNETSATDAGQPLSIGIRGDAVNRLTGDLSELIIAGSALSTYDVASLNSYLIAQHHLVFVNTNPTNLTFSVTGGNQLTLNWPADRIGWGLQSNSVGVTASGSWFPVPGSTATNQIVLPIDPTMTNVYYRMVYPSP